MQGDSGSDLYIGDYFVKRSGVVLVTINYRLGALGYATISKQITGNYGFYDQLLAFQWVAKEISVFGGNPNSVTIFGESAGGASVAAHLVSPKSSGLFHRAIIQSNPYSLPYRNDATSLGKNFAEKLVCEKNDFQCFLDKDVDSILAAQDAVSDSFNVFKPLEVKNAKKKTTKNLKSKKKNL